MDVQPLECLRRLLETATTPQDRREILDCFGELLSPSKKINVNMVLNESPSLYARRTSCYNHKEDLGTHGPFDHPSFSMANYNEEEQDKIQQNFLDSISLLDDQFSESSDPYESSNTSKSKSSDQKITKQKPFTQEHVATLSKEYNKASVKGGLTSQPQSTAGTEEAHFKGKVVMDGSLGWDPRFYAEIVPSGMAYCRNIWKGVKAQREKNERANRFAVLDYWRHGSYTASGMKHDIE